MRAQELAEYIQEAFPDASKMLHQQADELNKVIPKLVKANGLIENLRIRIAELEKQIKDAVEVGIAEGFVRAYKTSAEPVAMRYGYDGNGYQYIDEGSGSDWQTRIKDAEPLCTTPQNSVHVTCTDKEVEQELRIKQLTETQEYLYNRHDEQQDRLTKYELRHQEQRDRIAELIKSHVELERGILEDLNQRQLAKPSYWVLKTGHGTKFEEVKPYCEIDLWQPLYTTPQTSAEPVAWWDGRYFASKQKSSLADIPLYTTPQTKE